jgi:hypothetical protein
MFMMLHLALGGLSDAPAVVVENAAYRLEVQCAESGVVARLTDATTNLEVANGQMVYQASGLALEHASARRVGERLVLTGRLGGLDVEHTFSLASEKSFMEERIVLTNRSGKRVALTNLEIGFTRRLTSGERASADRWAAVPLRHRATDPKGHFEDFSTEEMLTRDGWEPSVGNGPDYRQLPSRHHISEAWAWLHGGHALCIMRFCQENMLWSVVSKVDGETLRLGGACMISGEPAALTRMEAGDRADLGLTRYTTVPGGYREASYAFRRFLDEQGCRFPSDYDPPVHWEQLYDMWGAWDHRPEQYTRAALEAEAEKGRAYSCESLYLDPGWDDLFASFKWGPWLGSGKEFVDEMRTKYGLKVSLHCPLATWMSCPFPMGPSSLADWPEAARRQPPKEPEPDIRVPAVLEGRPNLALLPEARVTASSVFENGAWEIHQIDHLIDGWYGNTASWIAGELPCWVEVDLGAAHEICEVRLGNDHRLQYVDRGATELTIRAAEREGEWREVAALHGEGLLATRSFSFAPVRARWVRIDITAGEGGLPRIDEIEIYGTEKASPDFDKAARRGPAPEPRQGGPALCLGSKQYLDEAEKRLLANCADGVAFLMFDGNWWNGGCDAPDHGHPVPYCWEDHIRANLELAQRVHAKYPDVLIEMHDTLAGGSCARPTPVYYKYGLPRSYDCNWGFELMWDPMADLREERALALYYYCLGCNVPLYLHINLKSDNRECVVLWWYASTCRHLGIGGTNEDPEVVRAEQAAMRWYHEHERFYKRGEFYGANEQVHLHVLPGEKAFVVNLFNLSDEERTISGSASLGDIGLDPTATYKGSEAWGSCANGQFRVELKMPPWSARVAAFRSGSPKP